jgi:exodeoxyribonuclease V gamma subunit
VLYRASTAKAKDKFQLYLMQLLIQQWQLQHIEDTSVKTSISSDEDKQLASVSESIGFYFNTKSQKTEIFSVSSIENAKEKLIQLINYYIKGQTKPLLLNGDIAAEVFAKTRGKPVEMTQNRFESLWEGGQNKRGFKDDVYLHYFWPQCPNIELYKAEIVDCYKTLYDVINKV